MNKMLSDEKQNLQELIYCELLKFFCYLPPEFLDTKEYGGISKASLEKMINTIEQNCQQKI